MPGILWLLTLLLSPSQTGPPAPLSQGPCDDTVSAQMILAHLPWLKVIDAPTSAKAPFPLKETYSEVLGIWNDWGVITLPTTAHSMNI